MTARDRIWKAFPRFIWGDALDRNGQFIEKEFLTHTEYPRFICEVEAGLTFDPPELTGSGPTMKIECGGYEFSNFVFLQPPPKDEDLMAACAAAAENAVLYDRMSEIWQEDAEDHIDPEEEDIADIFPDGWELQWTMNEQGKRAIHASGLVVNVTPEGQVIAEGADKLEEVDLGQLMAQAMIFLGVLKR